MRVEKFSVSYDDQMILDFPGMEFEPGKIYAIIGANGSGKSTFARGLSQKSVVEKNISVGYMPQKSYAFHFSVKKNILLSADDKERAGKLMQDLQIEHLAKKNASRLSGGETARMVLARILMKKFDLVILDEPTAAMDIETTSLAENLMMEYSREMGCVMILITHSLWQAKRVADEVLFFHKGQLVETGSKEQVLGQPKDTTTQKFLEFYGV